MGYSTRNPIRFTRSGRRGAEAHQPAGAFSSIEPLGIGDGNSHQTKNWGQKKAKRLALT